MTLSLQELSDRFEIQDLLVTYADAIDRRDWDALDDVFTANAVIDYTAVGGIRGTLADIKAFLAEGMAWFTSFQHLTANAKVTIDGDTATGRAICHNPMTLTGPDGEPHTMFIGIWYVDRYVRTEAGWRIAERSEERSYVHNPPPGFPSI
jgi:ketosteroid isomerase-like protein